MATNPLSEAADSDNVPEMKIGVVVYRLSDEGRSLTAEWYHTDLKSNLVGTGNAKRLSGADFEGEFDIMYATADGRPAGRFILRIVRRQEVYSLCWFSGDVKRFEGVGIKGLEGLLVGWNQTP